METQADSTEGLNVSVSPCDRLIGLGEGGRVSGVAHENFCKCADALL